MEYAEDDYLMLSGIQHFKFCRRQWALIHIEQQWAENVHTVVGELMHKSEKICLWQDRFRLLQDCWESVGNVMLLSFTDVKME